MNVGHLFAGAGGGLLASRILGDINVFAVELEHYPAEILRQRAADGWFPGLRVHEQDCRLFDPSEYAGRVDAIHAGWPCANISVAGDGAGIAGEQSGLWSEVARVAGILRPRELFLENSPAITTRGLGVVLGDLAALGYDARWCVLSGAAVGAPHIRARWWCLARRTNAECSERRAQHRTCGNTRENGIPQREESTDRHRSMGENVSDADSVNGRAGAERQNGAQANDTSWWGIEPALGRVAHGVADRVDRIKAIGNGQIPLCAAAAYVLLSA